MRLNTFTDSGVLQANITAKGSTLTDYLTLISEPVNVADAATKRYVDTAFSNLNVSQLTAGAISASNLPAMSGAAISSPGTGVVNLAPVVSSGSYVNPIVNSKGLVIGGNALQASDLPDIDWSVITSDKPTDVIGYGITDAVGTTGGVVNVNITLYGNPVGAYEAATKGYVDISVLGGGGAGVGVGDIMLKMSQDTPAGFLRCNGALVSKTTYANLYSLLKTDYDMRMVSGSGKPWVQQYLINLNNNIAFDTTVSGGLLAATSALGQVAVTRNKVFLFGGSNGFNLSNIQTATLAADGTIGSWTNLAMGLPAGMKNFQVLTTKNRLYLLGGVGTGNTNNSVLYSTIDATGAIGTWQTNGTLPNGVSGHRAFITSSRVYILGGSLDGNTTAVTNTYYAPIGDDGSIGTWVAGPDLPTPNQFFSIAVTKNNVYVIGGHTGSVTLSAVSSAPIDSLGVVGAWTTDTYLPQARAMGHAVVTDKYAYFLGGTQSNVLSGVSPEIMRAPIDASGVIGSWTVTTGSCAVRGGEAISVVNNIHILGGVDGSNNYLNTTFSYRTSNSGAPVDYFNYYNNPLFNTGGVDLFSLPDLGVPEISGVGYFIKY